ncbi:MAG TPA: exodeoxyribonuclease V subunit gamma, partial [Casimicrobiaceae bacterium]|nr:exodeoxyribonuclease V subunit gamma [Casimicrobiaceae bacterium]
VGATGDVMKHRELAALTRLAGDVRAQLAVGAARLSFVVEVTPRWPDTHGVAVFGEHDAALAHGLGDAGPLELHGVLENVTSNGLVLYRYARPGARDYLGAWLAHLVYCAAQPEGPRRTTWQGLGERFSFAPVAAPHEMLAPLVALFAAGRRAPLRFFPKSAWARMTGSEAQALGVWISDRVRGESDDPALEIAWRGTALTLDEPFAALARLVFEPLLKHLEGVAA